MIWTSEYVSPLGRITLACDDEALVGLWFNGQRYFGSVLPEVTAQREHPLFAEAGRWLDIYFSGKEPGFLPPLRYDTTPFRKRICDIMLTIPYGKTMTYGEIAAEAAPAGTGQNVCAGGRRRGGAQPDLPHDPVPPCGGYKRQPYRLWRWHPKEKSIAGAGACRYAWLVRTEEGDRALTGSRFL